MRRLLAILPLFLLLFNPANALAAAPDYGVPGGYFYTQAASQDGSMGFPITDDGQARFWTEFQRLGGVDGLGYPISQRFVWDDFIVQATQKGVLQWRPELGRAYMVNVFDQLSAVGKDDWLATVRSTPRPLDSSLDAGKSWDQIMASRLSLMDADPAIRARYFAAPDPLNVYGLPVSKVTDNGNHLVIRLQRAVIQRWLVDVPWAKAGQVTVANGGDVGKEGALYPLASIQPVASSSSQPSARSGGRPSPAQTALDAVNYYRALAGSPPLAINDSLGQSASAHANYYVQNYGDRALTGMGLHSETAGRPGFTGASWTDRARAAGYGGTVDENIGLVGDAERAIDWFIETINHRWNLIHPSAIHLGYGVATSRAIDVFDIGFSRNAPAVALPAVYPGNGQRGVPASALVYETPDPAPGVPRPLGFPLTISFRINDSVSFGSYGLSDSAGHPVQLYTSQKQWLRSLALIPARPLRSAETYTATVSGTVNGKPFTKTWSFTTA